jgi:TonB-linked SusC/RagA family outer membrane protein
MFLLSFFIACGATGLYAQSNFLQTIALPQAKLVHHSSTKLLVTVTFKNLALPKALRKTAHKANVGISFDANMLPKKKVSLHAEDMPIYKAMRLLLGGTGLEATRSESRDVLIIQKKPVLKMVTVQQHAISGEVTDANTGDPMPGVNILVVGTTIGAFTDSTGHYNLDVPSLQDTLRFSFIGYQTKTAPIGGRTVIDVEMEAKTFSAQKLVIVGYGKQRKISLVGAQSSIQNSSLLQTSTGSLTNSLAGRLSGVVGVQRSGLPGSDASDIWIRGISSINNKGPLILVDGIKRPMNSLNPDDIKSITILKDASATAVYGARGANGVILVKTKRGSKGKPDIKVNYYEGITTLTKIPDMAGGVAYMRLANKARKTRGESPEFSKEKIKKTEDGANPLLYPNVNWVKTLFKPYGHNRQLNANVSGGSDVARYRMSLSWYNDRGLLRNIDTTGYNTSAIYNKYNLSSNLTVHISPTTKANLGVGGYLYDKQYPEAGVSNIFEHAMLTNPVSFPVMYPGGHVPSIANENPFGLATLRGYTDQFLSQLFTNIDLTQKLDIITPGLSIHGLFGFDTRNDNTVKRETNYNWYYVNPNRPLGVDGGYDYQVIKNLAQNFLTYSNSNGGSRKFYLQADVRYNRTFRGDNQVTGLFHYSQSDNQNSFAGNLVSSIPIRHQAFAGRITYSYKDRYFVEFDAGYTGSEEFAPGDKFGFFPSGGVAWVLSNEKFWKPMKNVFQYFKIRYSNGLVGASGLPGRRFAFITLFNTSADGYGYGKNNQFDRNNGINISEIGVNVHWATSHKQDLGIDLRTLNNNLSLTVDFFKEHRTGIFVPRGTLPNFVGLFHTPFGNFGVTENKGIDGKIRYNGHFSNDLSLSIRGNFTYNHAVIISEDQAPQPYPWLNHRGNSLLAQYGFVAEGYFKNEKEIKNHATQFGKVLPGDIKYKDLNGDDVINALDKKAIGRGNVPILTLGTGINLGYKAFSLSLFVQSQFGPDRYIHGRGIMPFFGGAGHGNILKVIQQSHWTVDNPEPNAKWPRLGYGTEDNTNNFKESSHWIKRINFVRLKLIEFGYSIPISFLKNTAFSHALIYFRGRNLLTFSNFHLWDPEIGTSNGARYPNTKVYSLGFQIKF